MKTCPFCAEAVQDQAIKCKHCGSDLTHPIPSPPTPDAKPVASTMTVGKKKPSITRLQSIGLLAIALLVLLWFAYRLLAGQAMQGENTGLADVLGASSTQIYTMKVDATDDWATFNVAVNPGDVIYIKSANGQWRIKDACKMVGWRGHPKGTCETLLLDGRIMKKANKGALLWRTEGMEGHAFVADVGGAPLEIDVAGRLQFQINDDDVSDNDGELQLEIAITRGS